MDATRTGHVGSCYEYTKDGRILPGAEQATIRYMVDLSRKWPETFHQYVGTNGYVTWAHAGREIPPSDLPTAVRIVAGYEQADG